MKLRPLELRIKLYDEVHRLRRQGLSYNRIIEEVEKEHGVRLSKSHVYEWLRGIYNPRNKVKITLEEIRPSEDLAWLIGVIVGDGSTWNKNYNYVLILECKDLEFAMKFARCLEAVAECKTCFMIRNGYYRVCGYSKTLYNLLKKPLDLEKLKYYIEYNEETIRAFLRGFFDSEGSVDKRGYIYIFNTDLKLLLYIKELLTRLGIQTTRPHLSVKKGTTFYDKKRKKTYYYYKDVYKLYIRVNSRRRFAELIGSTIQRKRERLLQYIQ